MTLALGVLLTLQGIPCLYYGTEQGLSGHKTPGHMDDSLVREALWGKPGGGFSARGALARTLTALSVLRREWEPLRRGGQYFRPLSGDGHTFGLSDTPGGVLAYSRVWEGKEVLVVANTGRWRVLWSNRPRPAAPGPVQDKAVGAIVVCEENGSVTEGPARSLPVTVRAGEVQILAVA